MLKWFCDICQLEITAPDNPEHVRAYRGVKNRDDDEIGWGHSNDLVRVFCHKACADRLAMEITTALERVKQLKDQASQSR